MQQGGDLGLIDLERSRDFGLGKSASFHNPIDRGPEAGFGVELSSVGQAHIRKNIAAARCGGSVCSDRFFGLLSGKIVQLVVVVAVGM